MYKYILIIITVVIATSCIPDENPVKPYDRGNTVTSDVTLGPNYLEQVFYSLDQNKFLKSNNIYDWDLGFSCIDSTNDIMLNYSKFMKAYDLGFRDFNEVSIDDLNKITDEQWVYDSPEGKMDSTAINNWWTIEGGKVVSLGKIYIIDRGTNEIGKKLGNVKFQILNYDNKSYKIKYANLKDNVPYEHIITKDNIYNFAYLSLTKEGKTLQIEPPKTEWDVVFSKYTELLYTSEGDKVWYSVVGAYLNPFGAEGAMIRKTSFDSLDSRVLDTLKLSRNRNAVGHDWKYFDLGSSSYKVDPRVVFVIKGISGFIYKLHFVDFYDNTGNKGTPKFEFKKL